MHIQGLIERYFANGHPLYFGTKLSYTAGQCRERYAQIRDWVIHLDPDRPLGICLSFGPDYFLTVCACMEVGQCYVPLRTSWPDRRLRAISDRLKIAVVVCDENFESLLDQKSGASKRTQVCPEQPLYWICTSGSTGVPKVVSVPRRAYEHFCRQVQSQFSKRRILFALTHYTFDISYFDVALGMISQSPMCFSEFVDRRDIFALCEELQSHEVELLHTVPNNVRLLLQPLVSSRANLKSVKQVILGGQRISSRIYLELFRTWKNIESLVNAYGPTEGTIYTHYYFSSKDPGQDLVGDNLSIGQEAGQLKSVLMRDGKRLKKSFEQGELWISGPQLMKGYVNDIEKTQKVLTVFEDQLWYRTGDLCFRDAQDKIYVIGRLDDTVKRKGFRINLSEIDASLQKIPQIQEAATVAIDSEDHDCRLIAFVESRCSKIELRAVLREYLPDFQIPDEIMVVESLPTNNSGKLCKKTLKENYLKSRVIEKKNLEKNL